MWTRGAPGHVLFGVGMPVQRRHSPLRFYDRHCPGALYPLASARAYTGTHLRPRNRWGPSFLISFVPTRPPQTQLPPKMLSRITEDRESRASTKAIASRYNPVDRSAKAFGCIRAPRPHAAQ